MKTTVKQSRLWIFSETIQHILDRIDRTQPVIHTKRIPIDSKNETNKIHSDLQDNMKEKNKTHPG
jgi:hypothetical protein